MKKRLDEIEEILRNGKLPDTDLSRVRHEVWRRVLEGQRRRRKTRFLLRLPPWVWALASIVLILLCVLVMLWLN